ncbi:hypothetical protein CEP51_012316 [Fusarium floridanum]|uniref:Uncharacterized protein n=1 Tax=Fusarium floridanum TaxID=1325733 RepID=A0A428QW86_9HYPO|nr:hypothetical protein CEP51_012316 [Fusarium floridanum]
MGKAGKALRNFILSIPDDKINSFTDGEHTLYKDANYRLDNQGLTTGDPQRAVQLASSSQPRDHAFDSEAGSWEDGCHGTCPNGGKLDARHDSKRAA